MNTIIRKWSFVATFIAVLLYPFADTYSAIDKVGFQIIKQSDVPLPQTIDKILIADYFVSPRSYRQHKYSYDGRVFIDKNNIDTLLSLSAIDGFRSVVNDAAIYNINSDNIYTCKGDTALCRFPMSRKNALDVMLADSTKIMFALHNIDVVDVLSIDYQYPYYIADYVVYYISNWKRYDLDSDKYYSYDFKVETIHYNSVGNTEEDALRYLPDRYTALSDAAFAAGQKFAKLVSPHWEYVERQYYTFQIPELEQADELFKQKEITQAMAIWRKYTNAKGMAHTITYNMAVACEMLDRLYLALDWINTSISLKSTKQNNKYKTILINRIEAAKTIKGN